MGEDFTVEGIKCDVHIAASGASGGEANVVRHLYSVEMLSNKNTNQTSLSFMNLTFYAPQKGSDFIAKDYLVFQMIFKVK